MGSLLTRFRKQKTTVEILEEIETDISRLLKFKRQDQQLEKQYLGSLIIYSIVLYICGALLFYLIFWPQTLTETVVRAIPLLIFPFVIWGVRKLLQWYFIKRKIKNDIALEDLREKKKKILEDVKETESYKKAKEILERFDPSSRPPPPPSPTPVVHIGASQTAPNLRQRAQAAQMGRRIGGPPQPGMPQPGMPQPGMQQRPMLAIPNTPSQFTTPRRPVTSRPILPQQRGAVDKLMDYLVGDGPENRYALICKQCHSHNGMALKEEFEYLSFRCAYCNFLNESRKQRKNAPKLPEVSLLSEPASPPTIQEVEEEPSDSEIEQERQPVEGRGIDEESGSIDEVANTEEVGNTEDNTTENVNSREDGETVNGVNTEVATGATSTDDTQSTLKEEITEDVK
ncbi:endoplasmic reticulum junction formation protein lunapark-B-like [Anneissia japonica]|uniref:endoplasmic reticulum junction formation protein lunapark-B-like n=1 Tax=Anneissia japonica TaxID=1529436 RepID=UPI0014257C5A|nr:endoplasmic reticulum junction formation protein lunapark-B-like [Anneissia japonica]